VKTKSLFKRTAHMMQVLEHEAASAAAAERQVPPFRVGDVVDVSLIVPENKGRPSAFRGLVIARRNRGLSSSFRLRSVVNNYIVERSFPLYSPHVTSLAVVERRKVARAKLFFLRRKPISASRVPGGGGAGGAARSAVPEVERTAKGGAAAGKPAAKLAGKKK
jgi:large subunit ribosomal protein L19